MDLDNILLEPEQSNLLTMVVEASRNVPHDQRRKFLVVRNRGFSFLIHKGLGENKQIYFGDVETLANEDLINLTYASARSPQFDVRPLGFKYYEYLKNQVGTPVKQVEGEINSYIGTQAFKDKYTVAYEKWRDAQERLWSSESERELTTIGHLCREAMLEFADTLLKLHGLTNVASDKAHIVKRIRMVLNHRSAQLGKSHKEFLAALLQYWGTVSDLVQRQEHGAQRESEPLKWEDARRVTFQTVIVMYEIDRVLN